MGKLSRSERQVRKDLKKIEKQRAEAAKAAAGARQRTLGPVDAVVDLDGARALAGPRDAAVDPDDAPEPSVASEIRAARDSKQSLDEMVARMSDRRIYRAMGLPPEVFTRPPALFPAEETKMGDDGRLITVAVPKVVEATAPDARDLAIAQAKQKLQQQDALLRQMSTAAHMVGTVTALRGDRMTVVCGGTQYDVSLHGEAAVGSTVAILTESMQVAGVLRDVEASGQVATVLASEDGRVEVECGGQTRHVNTGSTPCDVGDRVVVDSSQSVVLRNLGKPRSLLAYEKATGTTWDDVGGHEEAKRVLRDAIESPKEHAELFARYGRRPTKGVLLYGPPGTGKTLLARAAATSLARTHGHDVAPGFIYVKGPALLSKWVGESESSVRGIFAAAREHQRLHGYPALVFIDEAEAVLGRRGSGMSIVTQTLVPQFLAEMDGLDDSGALVLLATNRPGDIDPAVMREGRIDRKVLVGRPRREDTERIAAIHLRRRPVADGHTAEDLARAVADAVHDEVIGEVRIGDRSVPLHLAMFSSGAMIAGIVESAAESALHRDVGTGLFSGVSPSDIRAGARRAAEGLVGVDPFEAAMEIVKDHPELVAAARETEPSLHVRPESIVN